MRTFQPAYALLYIETSFDASKNGTQTRTLSQLKTPTLTIPTHLKMARNLESWQREIIVRMICSTVRN